MIFHTHVQVVKKSKAVGGKIKTAKKPAQGESADWWWLCGCVCAVAWLCCVGKQQTTTNNKANNNNNNQGSATYLTLFSLISLIKF